MGRLIEESRVVDILQQTWLSGTIAHRFIDDIKRRIRIEVPTVEVIPKADYEARLKADMVAMLEELDLTIDEIPIVTRHGISGTVMTAQGMRKKIKENIQQKINVLKGDQAAG